MKPTEVLEFMRSRLFAVQASVSSLNGPQAAVVGIAVSDRFEVIFDTITSSRKAINLKKNSKIAFVFGGLTPGDERTVQYEGIADNPAGPELESLQRTYFARFPDGPQRLSWPGITCFRVRPTWIRYSDFNQNPPYIQEFNAMELGS